MKAAIVTLGCKVNQFESTALVAQLISAGYVMTQADEADVVVINTCTVTARAEQEALSLLRRLRRRNPGVRLVATGCLAQVNPQILSASGLTDLVLGQAEKSSLVAHIEDPSGTIRVGLATVPDLGNPMPTRTRVFQKIQDGCSAGCAYCAVPGARGLSRSQSLDRVLEGLEVYLKAGYQEVVWTGIHLGHWGRDLDPVLTLEDLLAAVEARFKPRPQSFRLRLSSIEPLEIHLVRSALSYGWLAPHLHAPLQSGSDRLLKLMGRPYGSREYSEIICGLHDQYPGLGLGTDVMVGFPGEDEQSLTETYNLIESLPLTYLHVFPYSPRSGTRASLWPATMSVAEKKAGVARLRALDKRKRADFVASQYGHLQIGLVEGSCHRPSGRGKVLTGNYLAGLLPVGFKATSGELLLLRLSNPDNPWALAEAVPEE